MNRRKLYRVSVHRTETYLLLARNPDQAVNLVLLGEADGNSEGEETTAHDVEEVPDGKA